MRLTEIIRNTFLALLFALPALAQSFTNPVLWEDLADLDIFRVGDVYYYSASTMHYSPGAPVLRSYDLVNWEYIGHSVPVLDWSSKYSMQNGQRAYVKGIWASTMRYRQSNGLFYWIGCIEFGTTYVYTAPSAAGPWSKKSSINNCYYDAGLLIDSDNTMYVAYGGTTISVAQLSADGLSQVRTQVVFTSPSSIGTLEGARFYKINGAYYIFLTRPANGQYILRATSPWGPYAVKQVLLNMGSPISGGGVPHQGGLVETQAGKCYPLTPRPLASPTGTDRFSGTALSHQWEWNHNPDTTAFTVNNGLTLRTASITNDLYGARNTLTHRILGPTSSATIYLNIANMRDGDRAGLALLRDTSAWIGVQNLALAPNPAEQT
ncbi:hypothetical protein HK097_001928 [Rhizophlyctis rosea]|uniref:Beta-xylosidase C-terminal Concanavalin A-like domain-containing protein n=1 Tax=Rhizophlyctis rosea TaxID=64517 RepID=A0AAD5SKY0_9FUNG|nr:hypothetical protein HK097_001928 [Rhizophlyctis rosea]